MIVCLGYTQQVDRSMIKHYTATLFNEFTVEEVTNTIKCTIQSKTRRFNLI